MKNKKGKIDIKDFISEIKKDPRKKALAFFAFYFVFFLILVITIRLGNTTTNMKSEETQNYSLKEITNGNYHFVYTINIDNKKFTYDGDKLNSKEKFIYTNEEIKEEFYRNNDLFLVNNNNEWIKTENPYVMKEFLNIEQIKTFLSSATYIGKTDYESGKITYHYQISTNTINKLLENINSDIDDIPNEISISTDNNDVNEINYTLNSYAKTKGYNLCNISMTYTRFNEIKDIIQPD